MNSMSLPLEQKEIFVKDLIISCPLGKPLGDCPLNDIRSLPTETRVEIVDQMDEVRLDQIIAYHQKCLLKRGKQ